MGPGVSISIHGGGGSAATPLSILGPSNVCLWLSAKEGVLNGSGVAAADGETVGTWTNLATGGGSDATQGTDTNRPVYRATGGNGGRPAIEFDGSDNFLVGTLTGTSAGDSWSLWIVNNPDALNNRATFDASDTTATNRGITTFFTVTPLWNCRYGAAGATSDATGTPAAAGSWRVTHFAGSTDARTIYENNAALTGGTNPSTTDRAVSALANYQIGALFGALFPYDGKFHELILAKVDASAAQNTAIDAYFGAEWGV